MDHHRDDNVRSAGPLNDAGKVTRRTMVAGTVAATAVATILPLSNSAYAETASSESQDMMAFLLLSEALTGVDRHTLAPELPSNDNRSLSAPPGVDPINIKDEYFERANKHNAGSFRTLLQIAQDNSQSMADIMSKVNGGDDNTQFLARSIVLLWYLGSWYDPTELQKKAASPDHRASVLSVVKSPKAYTQGLVWLIAGAHPMGYSNLQFGYWSRDPHDPSSPNLFNPAKP